MKKFNVNDKVIIKNGEDTVMHGTVNRVLKNGLYSVKVKNAFGIGDATVVCTQSLMEHDDLTKRLIERDNKSVTLAKGDIVDTMKKAIDDDLVKILASAKPEYSASLFAAMACALEELWFGCNDD